METIEIEDLSAQADEPVRYEEKFPERQFTYVDFPEMVPLCTAQIDADHIYYSQREERWDVIIKLIKEKRCILFEEPIKVYTLSSTKMWASWEFDPVNFIQVRVNDEPYWFHRDSTNHPLKFEEVSAMPNDLTRQYCSGMKTMARQAKEGRDSGLTQADFSSTIDDLKLKFSGARNIDQHIRMSEAIVKGAWLSSDDPETYSELVHKICLEEVVLVP